MNSEFIAIIKEQRDKLIEKYMETKDESLLNDIEKLCIINMCDAYEHQTETMSNLICDSFDSMKNVNISDEEVDKLFSIMAKK